MNQYPQERTSDSLVLPGWDRCWEQGVNLPHVSGQYCAQNGYEAERLRAVHQKQVEFGRICGSEAPMDLGNFAGDGIGWGIKGEGTCESKEAGRSGHESGT